MCSTTYHYTMVLLLFTCIFVIELGMVSTSTAINWIKLRGHYVEDICPAEDIRFVKDSVVAAVTCGRICYEDEECKAVTYQVDDHKCTGCREFLKSLPTVNSAGLLKYSKKVLVCHDWTEEDDKAIIAMGGASRMPMYEQTYCENCLGYTWTEEYDPKYPECGVCRCCKPKRYFSFFSH
ncbi:uncharacterized protein LOC132728243 [Ruditapes philippinarum]|uniref:uncharacterized protein LOC132728243 n=1 Tax=Ruditapes philippinarum TaxID=129788 RepID=UPI00295AC9A2|nr:uncharacterized protein LOC132728243 [Ruditapes philippinarum]